MSIIDKITDFLGLGEGKERRVHAHNLYVAIVTDARNPEIYTSCSVEDSVDGRFDMIVLHLSLLLKRIKDAKADGDAEYLDRLSKELIGVYNNDMDRNLREIGVGDMSVGKHVKKMAKAFYGRLFAYDQAIINDEDKNTNEQMNEALLRNVYRGEAPEGAVAELLDYVASYRKHLDAVPHTSLEKGTLPSYIADNK